MRETCVQTAGSGLRPPHEVMRLKRLGALHQCRLSFMRVLLRRLARDAWRFKVRAFDIDQKGVGHAVYSAEGPQRTYSLVAFAHDLPDALRSDRVIAERWDATFALYDGIPSEADIQRLSENVPRQEAGRLCESEISLSRANRSVRLWDYVVAALASGHQPSAAEIDDVGYLMRTTAVYGSGKFGAVDREQICGRAEMQAPFQAEMLSVYLTRWFVRDLLHHMARVKGGHNAVALDSALACRLGIGNSTGLGMAPFIMNHPVLFNNWILARETAIARVRAVEWALSEDITVFMNVLRGAVQRVAVWHSNHAIQKQKLADLRHDIHRLEDHLCAAPSVLARQYPWDGLMDWAAATLSEEGQEFLASLILEPYGDLVDDLADTMADDSAEIFHIQGSMPLSELRALLHQKFDWALALDWACPDSNARVWYVSEEKLEPRLGERHQEDLCAYEQPLAPARDAVRALGSLDAWDDDALVADFVLKHPEHRHTVRRAQIARAAPYSDIRDNTISAHLMPIDLLRAKLSFFGATQFDPRSDRWVRICMYAGAPYPEDLNTDNAAFWVYSKGRP